MRVKDTLLELSKLLEKWDIARDDWALIYHYADMLSDYDIKYGRDEHMHIIADCGCIPWKVNKKNLNKEIIIPHQSKYSEDFDNFIKKTRYDFHLYAGGRKIIKNLVKKYSYLYKIKNRKFRVITTLGNLLYWDLSMSLEKDMLDSLVVTRRLGYIESLLKESQKKKDKKVEKLAREIIIKFKPKKQVIIKNEKKSLALYKKSKIIKGEIGYPGKVKGKVFYIKNPDRPPKIRKGYILVTKLTSPKLLPYIKNSQAVITDEGGQLSHAAVFCREFKIPCIVGTKIATKVFKNNNLIEIDANIGTINIIS